MISLPLQPLEAGGTALAGSAGTTARTAAAGAASASFAALLTPASAALPNTAGARAALPSLPPPVGLVAPEAPVVTDGDDSVAATAAIAAGTSTVQQPGQAPSDPVPLPALGAPARQNPAQGPTAPVADAEEPAFGQALADDAGPRLPRPSPVSPSTAGAARKASLQQDSDDDDAIAAAASDAPTGIATIALQSPSRPAPLHREAAAVASGAGDEPGGILPAAASEGAPVPIASAARELLSSQPTTGAGSLKAAPDADRSAAPTATVATAPTPPPAVVPEVPTVPPRVAEVTEARAPEHRLALGHDFADQLGLVIARHSKAGGDELTIRMHPAELGRIDIKLGFDDGGSLRAVVSTDSAQLLDAVRRDLPDLTRALGDAGVRSDERSFSFQRSTADSSGGNNSAGGQSNSSGHSADPRRQQSRDPQKAWQRPLRRSGRLDLMA